MNYQTLTPKQKEWLGWVLDNRRDTLLQGKVDAKRNIISLNWSYVNGVYDVYTKALLNYILKEFNEDDEAKKQWKIHNDWKVKLDDKI
jgi:hypothetical protein